MNFFQFLLSLPSLIKGILSLVKLIESHLGPDWVSKLNDIKIANDKMERAQTNDERDEALKAIAGAFYRKP